MAPDISLPPGLLGKGFMPAFFFVVQILGLLSAGTRSRGSRGTRVPPQGSEGCRSVRPCLPRTCEQAPEGVSASVAGRLSARPDFLCVCQ